MTKQLKNNKLRHNEYYNMQSIYDELYQKSKNGCKFKKLMKYITCENNIKLAYRNIKNNTGSKTYGTDFINIKDIEKISVEEFVQIIQRKFDNYQPKLVKRVEIPKEGSDKTRPLGIPTMYDRIIQQCIFQVLEPICEAKFYEHSYGFRPNRSVEQAIAQIHRNMQISHLHYCIDVDIKGFFDNVNHSKLLKQMWTLGIQDKKLLAIIRKIIKAPIKMPDKTICYPTKGTPQGGILSPLLSNIVLNELDWWVSSNWENIPTKKKYYTLTLKNGTVSRSGTYEALKKTRLKEMRIVRYADDFKIFCRNYNSAKRTFYAIKGWLKDRLKLDISSEKSKIVNLRKHYSNFLGFKLKVHKKRNKYTVTSNMSDKAIKNATKKLIEQIKLIQKPVNNKEKYKMIQDYNSKVMGIHNYYKIATKVCLDCRKISFQIMAVFKNRMRKNFKSVKFYKKRNQKIPNISKVIKINYGKSNQIRFIDGYAIAPIGYIQNKVPICKRKSVNKYTPVGRLGIHKNLGIDMFILLKLMQNPITNRSIQFADNRISLYAWQYGRCAVTGIKLNYNDIHCHHKIPINKGGTDEYKNLIIVHKDIHRLIHATIPSTILKYISEYKNQINLNKLNELRNLVGNIKISSLDNTITC
ncbi:group II intron reverse transcriptase/maturase [Clostridium perfringens]|uniref:Group II intron reverse transcriptase maturase n=1 Tax=Clostridium perfringens B str. ATCC 3626 TaxID=451754 RepID=A0AAV3BPT6_CLOPF|nr:group II intron reverse transcriptase/maturase [Clostridium perfringens]EDT23168.1 group II intron reverse transcriptase maturase [Clostridium perfringens B str. ATCC 3626]MDU1414796.1 group II intron reverse transcriptase/maturase [Clostridium sp.]